MTTFLWHDYETFGLSPSMDRPAQFAAIRTDERLEKIGSSVCLQACHGQLAQSAKYFDHRHFAPIL